jgi:hypothetical protein
MGYVYTQENRLETPHSYMYAPYEGEAFLEMYFTDRANAISRWGVSGKGFFLESVGDSLRQLLPCIVIEPRNWRQFGAMGNAATSSQNSLFCFNVNQEVDTRSLLECLVTTQMAGARGEAVNSWLDRLTQRFEVSKRLFDSYRPGFRKGEGESKRVGLYWMLAVALCLFYADTGRIKYLSTQLKITDLLCSLPLAALEGEVPMEELGLLIRAEVTSVRQLLTQKGIESVS